MELIISNFHKNKSHRTSRTTLILLSQLVAIASHCGREPHWLWSPPNSPNDGVHWNRERLIWPKSSFSRCFRLPHVVPRKIFTTRSGKYSPRWVFFPNFVHICCVFTSNKCFAVVRLRYIHRQNVPNVIERLYHLPLAIWASAKSEWKGR